MSVSPWFAQPAQALGTAILLPGRQLGVATPVLHWSATLLTQSGWSVVGVTWDEAGLDREAVSHVRRCAEAAMGEALDDRPVLLVAKSVGTLALPWAVDNGLPGVWLTPLLQEAAVASAAAHAQQPTLLVGGTADPHWRPPKAVGPGVTLVELPGADHGLQQPGDWRRSVLEQLTVFERVNEFADLLLAGRDGCPARRG